CGENVRCTIIVRPCGIVADGQDFCSPFFGIKSAQVFHFSGIFMNIARSADLFKPNLPGSSFLDKADSVTMGANSMSGNMDHPDKRDMLFSGTDAFIADQFEVS